MNPLKTRANHRSRHPYPPRIPPNPTLPPRPRTPYPVVAEQDGGGFAQKLPQRFGPFGFTSLHPPFRSSPPRRANFCRQPMVLSRSPPSKGTPMSESKSSAHDKLEGKAKEVAGKVRDAAGSLDRRHVRTGQGQSQAGRRQGPAGPWRCQRRRRPRHLSRKSAIRVRDHLAPSAATDRIPRRPRTGTPLPCGFLLTGFAARFRLAHPSCANDS